MIDTMPQNDNDAGEKFALSIVIPAFNEFGRLDRTLKQIRDFAQCSKQTFEVVVVDDGSVDGTSRLVRPLEDGPSPLPLVVRLLVNERNRGKGFSVRRGMLEAKGDLLLMCDADLSAPIEDVQKLLPWLERGYDVVIGSRDLPDSVLDPPQPLFRRLLAWTFRAIRRRLLLPEIRDTQCGFKLFRRQAAREIFARQTIDGWLFDCEVLGIAEQLGYRIKEVGITWRDDPDSRVRVLGESVRALRTLFQIRRRLRESNRQDAKYAKKKKM